MSVTQSRRVAATRTSCLTLAGAACVVALAGGPTSIALADPPVILQWFEARWGDAERRIPDFYLAGYGAVWLPPPTKANSTLSAGYDVLDRFDLGRPGASTAYGNEQNFKALVGELHQANGLVYVDAVLNHNSARDGSTGWQNLGGWPGFWMASATPAVTKTPTSNWGDFHNGIASGYYQSENPGGARYDLYKGDLVALVDIAQETNNVFIRHPVVDGNPQNIPAGSLYNKPDPNNYRCYPDRDLTPTVVNNPGTFRNPGANNFTFYPYNAANPLLGDPVTDNGTGLLMRWTQWMLDEQKVDGFRWDAVKHVPSWFWDTFIDSELYQRRTTPDGRKVTPYSFGESVESNSFTYDNMIRKTNNNSGQFWRAGDSFGNRDALDINGSGALRDLVNGGGLGTWSNVLNNHLDNADGFNDGTLGVNHVFSHDNGTTGDGGSQPATPTIRQMGLFANAYVLMRTGQSKLYHNANGFTNRSGGFWPKGGINIALGVDPASNAANAAITTLVRLKSFYGRGEFNVLNSTDTVNPSLDDVLVFERRTNTGAGYSANVLVGCNDSYSNGVQWRSVLTSFPPNTRLLEMTGNAADPTIDPTSIIPEVLTVGSDNRVLLPIPNNKNSSGVEHNKGYVVYGPAIPSGTLSLTNVTATLPADPGVISSQRRRNAAIPVIRSNSFQIQLTTTNGDAGAANNDNADDNAVFRIDQGFRDFNGNGITDIDYTSEAVPGYEQFVTLRQPLAGTPGTNGQYAQTIDATTLSEGIHYISVVAFRKRGTGEAPLFREFRQVVYIDRTGPDVDLLNPEAPVKATSFKFTARAADRTANKVHIIYELADGADPIAAANVNNQATQSDRFDFTRTIGGLQHGYRRVTVVAFEEGGSSAFQDYSVFVDLCPSDFNDDGFVDAIDYDSFLTAWLANDLAADVNGDEFVDAIDYDEFIQHWLSAC